MAVGFALVAWSVYMLVYVGHFKKVYSDWFMTPQHTAAEITKIQAIGPTIHAFRNNHPFLWAIGPLTPLTAGSINTYGLHGCSCK